ncbi:MAG: DUF4160 domain-containing protein [Bacteroidia bacterium]|nr:DUF4160 domain-containing protein [Bacteroidia bacterium]
MPKIAVYKTLIFYIVSFDLSERIHLHVFSKNHNRQGSAKIWLDTNEVFSQGALTDEEINIAVKLLEKNKNLIKDTIEKFRTSNKIKTIQLKLK